MGTALGGSGTGGGTEGGAVGAGAAVGGGRASGKTMAGISSRKVKSAGEGGVGCSAKGKEFSSKMT